MNLIMSYKTSFFIIFLQFFVAIYLEFEIASILLFMTGEFAGLLIVAMAVLFDQGESAKE